MGTLADLMFPYPQHLPPRLTQEASIVIISASGRCDFRFPLFGQLHSPSLETPSVPEITVNEDAEGVLPQHEIRPARERADMALELQFQCFKYGLDCSLRAGVAAPYAAHDGATGRRTHKVTTMLSRWWHGSLLLCFVGSCRFGGERFFVLFGGNMLRSHESILLYC